MTLGKEGIPEASQNAVLNANYMMNKLKDLYTMAGFYKGKPVFSFYTY